MSHDAKTLDIAERLAVGLVTCILTTGPDQIIERAEQAQSLVDGMREEAGDTTTAVDCLIAAVCMQSVGLAVAIVNSPPVASVPASQLTEVVAGLLHRIRESFVEL